MLADLARVLYDEPAIFSRLDAMAASITRDYDHKELTVLAVLNGSFMFLADLLRRIPLPLRVDCISVASYHGGTESSGSVTFDQLTPPEVRDRHVLILDDILDSGRTLDAIQHRLGSEGARSIRTCVLLRKNKARALPIDADYVGFDIADEFVVGYGLDFQEKYRNLPCIGVLHPHIVTAALATAP
jgi:hypoxanthine phosphoribosyltransferase